MSIENNQWQSSHSCLTLANNPNLLSFSGAEGNTKEKLFSRQQYIIQTEVFWNISVKKEILIILYLTILYKQLITLLVLISRPGQCKGLLYKHYGDSLTH